VALFFDYVCCILPGLEAVRGESTWMCNAGVFDEVVGSLLSFWILIQLVLGWRLGYKTLVYAEDAARWPGYVSTPPHYPVVMDVVPLTRRSRPVVYLFLYSFWAGSTSRSVQLM